MDDVRSDDQCVCGSCERLRAELALARAREQEAEERFRTVLAQSVDGVYRRDLKTDHYDFLSPAFETITGFTFEEFARMSRAEVALLVHPDDRAVIERRVAELKRSRVGEEVSGLFEYRLMRKDGVYRWISDSGVMVFGPDGEPRFYVGIARDVTDLKRAEEELRHSNEGLEKAVSDRTARLRHLASELVLAEQRERKRLLDFLHDDLQQVLVAAKFGMERLVSDQPAGAAECQVRLLVGYVTEAVGKVRAFCRGLTTPLLYVVGLVPALRELVQQMEARYGLRVVSEFGDAPDIDDEAVKVQLFQSARELLFNAAKHSGSETARLRVGCSGGRLEITVADEGRGFNAGAFMGGGSSGCGCGLFSVRERITALGGELRIESSPGCGTSVTLFMPFSPGQVAAPVAVPRPDSSSGARAVSGGSRARVLVADDHEMVRAGLSNLLSQDPCLEVVGEARNGWEAVTLARQLRPDVIVMDIKMPEMDGIEATRIIRAEFPGVIVIGLSAFGNDGFRPEMLDAGAADLLDKAEASATLRDRISSCLACRNEVREEARAVK